MKQTEKLVEISNLQEICLAIALNIHWGITKLQRDLLIGKELRPDTIARIEKHIEIYKVINDLFP